MKLAPSMLCPSNAEYIHPRNVIDGVYQWMSRIETLSWWVRVEDRAFVITDHPRDDCEYMMAGVTKQQVYHELPVYLEMMKGRSE